MMLPGLLVSEVEVLPPRFMVICFSCLSKIKAPFAWQALSEILWPTQAFD